MGKSSCSYDRKLEKGSLVGPSVQAFPGQAQEGASRLKNNLPARVRPLPIRVSTSQCSSCAEGGSERNTHEDASHSQQTAMAKEMAPEHPSV